MYLLIVAENITLCQGTGMSVFHSLIHACFPHMLVQAAPQLNMLVVAGEGPRSNTASRTSSR